MKIAGRRYAQLGAAVSALAVGVLLLIVTQNPIR